MPLLGGVLTMQDAPGAGIAQMLQQGRVKQSLQAVNQLRKVQQKTREVDQKGKQLEFAGRDELAFQQEESLYGSFFNITHDALLDPHQHQQEQCHVVCIYTICSESF